MTSEQVVDRYDFLIEVSNERPKVLSELPGVSGHCRMSEAVTEVQRGGVTAASVAIGDVERPLPLGLSEGDAAMFPGRSCSLENNLS